MSELKLKDLKVGDKVIVSTRFNGESIATIEKITPKGFLKNDIKKLEQRQFIKTVLEKMHYWKNLDYEQAKAINELLEKRKNETD